GHCRSGDRRRQALRRRLREAPRRDRARGQVARRLSMSKLTELAEWKALRTHFEQVRSTHLRDLFAADPKRGERLTAEAVGLFVDYSKHRITDETLDKLLAL